VQERNLTPAGLLDATSPEVVRTTYSIGKRGRGQQGRGSGVSRSPSHTQGADGTPTGVLHSEWWGWGSHAPQSWQSMWTGRGVGR